MWYNPTADVQRADAFKTVQDLINLGQNSNPVFSTFQLLLQVYVESQKKKKKITPNM